MPQTNLWQMHPQLHFDLYHLVECLFDRGLSTYCPAGTLPPTFGYFPLKTLWASNNNLTGRITPECCECAVPQLPHV